MHIPSDQRDKFGWVEAAPHFFEVSAHGELCCGATVSTPHDGLTIGEDGYEREQDLVTPNKESINHRPSVVAEAARSRRPREA